MLRKVSQLKLPVIPAVGNQPIRCRFSDDQKLRQEMVKAGALNVAKQVGDPGPMGGTSSWVATRIQEIL